MKSDTLNNLLTLNFYYYALASLLAQGVCWDRYDLMKIHDRARRTVFGMVRPS